MSAVAETQANGSDGDGGESAAYNIARRILADRQQLLKKRVPHAREQAADATLAEERSAQTAPEHPADAELAREPAEQSRPQPSGRWPARRTRLLRFMRDWRLPISLIALCFGAAIVLSRRHDIDDNVVWVAYAVVFFAVIANNGIYLRALRLHGQEESTRLQYEEASLPDAQLSIARVEKLLERLDRQERLLTQNVLRNAFLCLLLGLPVLGTTAALFNPDALIRAAVAIGLFEILAVIGFVFARNRARQLESAVQQADYELNLLMPVLTNEQRAERLYLKQQFELKRYYDEALRQSSSLSYIGAGCVLGGFVIVGVTFGLVSEGKGSQQIATAVVGGVGGVLANFVAVVFLQMHSGTIRALTAFHDRLVSTNHMHLAHLMVSRVGVAGVPPAQSIALVKLAPYVASGAVGGSSDG